MMDVDQMMGKENVSPGRVVRLVAIGAAPLLLALVIILGAWLFFIRPASSAQAGPDLSEFAAAAGSSARSGKFISDESPLIVHMTEYKNGDGDQDFWIWGFVRSGSSNNECGVVTIDPPDGAMLTSFNGYIYDNYNNGGTEITLYRQNYRSVVGPETMGGKLQTGVSATSGNTQHLTDSSLSITRIDKSNYHYFAEVCIDPGGGNNLRVNALEIEFIRVLYLPSVGKEFCSGTPEEEPNDTSVDATGPIVSGATYSGSPDDLEVGESPGDQDSDYYWFNTSGSGTITAVVTGYLPANAELQLYDNSLSLKARDFTADNGTYTVSYSGGAGKYYVRAVSADGHATGNGCYQLTVTFP